MADDRQTISRCLDGHPHDFRLLVDRYAPTLRAYLRPHAGDREQVEETVQETLVRAFFSLGRLRERESFWSWLLGIGHRVAKEHRRERQRLSGTGGLDDHQARKAVFVSRDEELERLIDALPEPYREIVLLRFFAGLSCKAIAAQRDESVSTVTKSLSRAYTLLRDSLGQQHASPRAKERIP